ncbi:hypothetical protein ACTFIR_003945 [Dictyostelium discoideum]
MRPELSSKKHSIQSYPWYYDVASKLNTQTDITECREAIKELVLNNAGEFSIRRPSASASNTGEKFPMEKNHAVSNHNSLCRNSFEVQAEKIIAIIMLISKISSYLESKAFVSILVNQITKELHVELILSIPKSIHWINLPKSNNESMKVMSPRRVSTI